MIESDKIKNISILVLGILTIILIFSLSITISSNRENIKTIEKQYNKEIDSLKIIADRAIKNSTILIDSAAIYKNYAQKVAMASKEINKKVKENKQKTNVEIARIDTLPVDSQLLLFTRLSEDYLR